MIPPITLNILSEFFTSDIADTTPEARGVLPLNQSGKTIAEIATMAESLGFTLGSLFLDYPQIVCTRWPHIKNITAEQTEIVKKFLLLRAKIAFSESNELDELSSRLVNNGVKKFGRTIPNDVKLAEIFRSKFRMNNVYTTSRVYNELCHLDVRVVSFAFNTRDNIILKSFSFIDEDKWVVAVDERKKSYGVKLLHVFTEIYHLIKHPGSYGRGFSRENEQEDLAAFKFASSVMWPINRMEAPYFRSLGLVNLVEFVQQHLDIPREVVIQQVASLLRESHKKVEGDFFRLREDAYLRINPDKLRKIHDAFSAGKITTSRAAELCGLALTKFKKFVESLYYLG